MQSVINILHITLLLFLGLSIFIKNKNVKMSSLIILIFISLHFITKYGKCGLINIEKFILKDNFRNGFLFRLMRPVIYYKNNYFYENLFWLMLIYIFILYYQINENKNFL
jgi:hypothetical protein